MFPKCFCHLFSPIFRIKKPKQNVFCSIFSNTDRKHPKWKKSCGHHFYSIHWIWIFTVWWKFYLFSSSFSIWVALVCAFCFVGLVSCLVLSFHVLLGGFWLSTTVLVFELHAYNVMLMRHLSSWNRFWSYFQANINSTIWSHAAIYFSILYNMSIILVSTTKRVLHLIRFYLFQFFFYAIYLCCSSSSRCSIRATFFYTLNETYVNWNEQVYEACVRNSKMIDVEMLRKLLMWKILIGFGGYDALNIRNRKLMMAESAKSRLFFDVQLLVCFFFLSFSLVR